MPRFIVDIQKRDSGNQNRWGNRYIVDADDLVTAHGSGLNIVVFERAIHFQNIVFVQLRTSTQTPFDADFIVSPLVGTGDRINDGKVMPLFCTLSLNLISVTGGRHGLKFYHTGFGDTFYDGDGTYDDTYLTDVLTDFGTLQAAMAADGTHFTSPSGGHVYNGASPVDQVTSHQFTKASKRPPA